MASKCFSLDPNVANLHMKWIAMRRHSCCSLYICCGSRERSSFAEADIPCAHVWEGENKLGDSLSFAILSSDLLGGVGILCNDF